MIVSSTTCQKQVELKIEHIYTLEPYVHIIQLENVRSSIIFTYQSASQI